MTDRWSRHLTRPTLPGMPPFDLKEMDRLFDLYKEHCNPVGVSRQIQDRIVHESGGHPASFMILLKLVLQHRPDECNWTYLLQENIGRLLNGTQTKLRMILKSMKAEQKARVRDLTENQMKDWEFVPDDLNQYLLNIGVLDSFNDRTAGSQVVSSCVSASMLSGPNKRIEYQRKKSGTRSTS